MQPAEETAYYHIGPGDSINIFVWENPELSVSVPVRPDGRINTPLVEDLRAAGRTPTELARAVERELSTYLKNPVVTVMVSGFRGLPSEQIRVVGEAAQPQAIPYRSTMTLLDVMIAVGGLTEFAAGDRSVLIREVDGERRQFNVRLDDLLQDGDISANVKMHPGDILIIPEAWF
ncbi:XrtA/PEP-CTERM system exopolysaccharide export protein [Thiohalorhabdus sp.]|uniref:XrtA/PEP-CTERM system exopolysaccharide export protein n=1 Tax=Thiohalorhabdus sp. TaxID=3094134 RepID=UPI002FC3A42C